MQVTGNTILITGGTSGIGRGLAEAFHKLGNQVIIAGRRKALIDEVTSANPGMKGIELDIADPRSIQAAATALVANYPTLNVLINNAGFMPFDDAAAVIDDDMLQKTLTTDLMGPIRLTSALIEHLKTQTRATIVNNTSVLAYVPLADSAVYSAAKAALHSYTLSQRFMLRDTSVSVQEIAPPWVDTDLGIKGSDARAMPLDAYIEETMAGLATDTYEIVSEGAMALRANPGLDEHALVHGFNATMAENPVPR